MRASRLRGLQNAVNTHQPNILTEGEPLPRTQTARQFLVNDRLSDLHDDFHDSSFNTFGEQLRNTPVFVVGWPKPRRLVGMASMSELAASSIPAATQIVWLQWRVQVSDWVRRNR
jgi:hypothetical protein